MARQAEGKLQDKIIKRLKERRAAGEPLYWLKVSMNQYMPKGTPDLLVCAYGRFLALEIKRPGEKARPDQELEMQRWRSAGAESSVICDPADVDAKIDMVKNLVCGGPI